MKLLQVRHAHPLEREYEAWIVSGIESYLTSVGYRYSIWAVSPEIEAKWPADEILITAGKLVGLQFKQAKLATGRLAPDRLKWTLHKPKGQFELIQASPEIFYCLPTFVDRASRSKALDHCMFWRPNEATNYNVWYDNPAAHTPYKKVRDAMRWGHFFESLLYCEVGKRVEDAASAQREIAAIYSKVREQLHTKHSRNEERSERTQEAEPGTQDLGFYLLYVSL
ncbi:hypothetical protein ACSFA2_01880 [Variovorax sp. LT2P21]|uniref:hypothetical protein n=1 Tax=Variovorax sp. LT2P21 TaxID=3443731 RepID=UPI003F480A66